MNKLTQSISTIVLLCCIATVGQTNSQNQILKESNMDKYEQLFRENFLKSLEKNGYNKGFDFDKANIDIGAIDGYNVPRITGSLSYTGHILYVPKGLEFERMYELSMILNPDGIEFKTRDRGTALHYWAADYPDLPYQQGVTLIKKGAYPGVQYFEDEIAVIEASLKKHQPVIKIHSFTQQSFNLGDELNGVMQRSPNFYQVSDDVVYMEFVYDAQSQIDFGFKIHYNLKTGEIINQRAMSPPSFM